jgi:hypothetical protein
VLNQTDLNDKSEGKGGISRLKTQLLKLHLIRCDAGTQSRAAINEDVVSEYAERMLEGDKFPPAEVFFDGNQYYLADGFHRILAANRNGFLDFECHVRTGTLQDALWFSIGANRQNGVRRSPADKRRAIELALMKFPDRSNVVISRHVGCSESYVRKVHDEIQVRTSANLKQELVTGRDGKQYPSKKNRAGLTCDEQLPIQNETCEASAVAVLPQTINEEVTVQEIRDELVPGGRNKRPKTKKNFAARPDHEPQPAANGDLEPSRAGTFSEEESDEMDLSVGEPAEARERILYHLELIKADAEILLERFKQDSVEPDDLKDSAAELVLAAKLFRAYAKTMFCVSQN